MDKDTAKFKLTTGQLTDIARLKNPNVYRNNRGSYFRNKQMIKYGIPEPKKKEKEDDLKGSDLIGYRQVIITPDMIGKTIAVFTCIEIKGPGDKIKEGQIKFHNMILARGGLSEIHLSDGTVIKTKTTKKEVNKR